MADRDAFDTATRIAAGDDKANYDNVAITLHWLTALLVIVQFLLAVTWDYFPHDTQENLQSVHVSLGVLLTGVVVARILWRLGHHRSPIVSGWQRTASTAVHYLLYLLLVVQAGLGFTWRWAQGHGVAFFGLFAIPGPYGALARPTGTCWGSSTRRSAGRSSLSPSATQWPRFTIIMDFETGFSGECFRSHASPSPRPDDYSRKLVTNSLAGAFSISAGVANCSICP